MTDDLFDDYDQQYRDWTGTTPQSNWLSSPGAALDDYFGNLKTRPFKPLPLVSQQFQQFTAPRPGESRGGYRPGGAVGAFAPAGPPERFNLNLLGGVDEGPIMGLANSPLGQAFLGTPGQQRGGAIGPGIATAPVNFQNFATYAREGTLSLITSALGHNYQQSPVPYAPAAGPVNNENILENLSQGDFGNVLDNVIDGVNVVGDVINAPIVAFSNMMRSNAAQSRGEAIRDLVRSGGTFGDPIARISSLWDQSRFDWGEITKKAIARGLSTTEMAAQLWDLSPDVVEAIAQNPDMTDEELDRLVEGQPFSYDPAVNLIAELGITLLPMLGGAYALRAAGATLKGIGVLGRSGQSLEGLGLLGRPIATAERLGSWSLQKAWRVYSSKGFQAAGLVTGLTPRGLYLGAGIRFGEWAIKQAAVAGGNAEAVRLMDEWLWEMPLSNNPGLNLVDAFAVHPIAIAKQGVAAVRGSGVAKIFGKADTLPVDRATSRRIGTIRDMPLATVHERIGTNLGWELPDLHRLFDPDSPTGLTERDLKNGLIYVAQQIVRERNEARARYIDPTAGVVERAEAFWSEYAPEAVKIVQAELTGRGTAIADAIKTEFWERGEIIEASDLGKEGGIGPYDGTIALQRFASWLLASKRFGVIADEALVPALRDDVNLDFLATARADIAKRYKPGERISARDLNTIQTYIPRSVLDESGLFRGRKNVPVVTRRALEAVLDRLERGQQRVNEAATGPRTATVPVIAVADQASTNAIARAFKLNGETIELLERGLVEGVDALGPIPPQLEATLGSLYPGVQPAHIRADPAAYWPQTIEWYGRMKESAIARGEAIEAIDRLERHFDARTNEGSVDVEALRRIRAAIGHPYSAEEIAKNPLLANIVEQRDAALSAFVDRLSAWLDSPLRNMKVRQLGDGQRIMLETDGFGPADVAVIDTAIAAYMKADVPLSPALDATILAPELHPLEKIEAIQAAIDAGLKLPGATATRLLELGNLVDTYGALVEQAYPGSPVTKAVIDKLTNEVATSADELVGLREQARGLAGLIDRGPSQAMSDELGAFMERARELGSTTIGVGKVEVPHWHHLPIEPEGVIAATNEAERAVRIAAADRDVASKAAVFQTLDRLAGRATSLVGKRLEAADYLFDEVNPIGSHPTRKAAFDQAKELQAAGIATRIRKVGSRWKVERGELTPEAVARREAEAVPPPVAEPATVAEPDVPAPVEGGQPVSETVVVGRMPVNDARFKNRPGSAPDIGDRIQIDGEGYRLRGWTAAGDMDLAPVGPQWRTAPTSRPLAPDRGLTWRKEGGLWHADPMPEAPVPAQEPRSAPESTLPPVDTPTAFREAGAAFADLSTTFAEELKTRNNIPWGEAEFEARRSEWRAVQERAAEAYYALPVEQRPRYVKIGFGPVGGSGAIGRVVRWDGDTPIVQTLNDSFHEDRPAWRDDYGAQIQREVRPATPEDFDAQVAWYKANREHGYGSQMDREAMRWKAEAAKGPLGPERPDFTPTVAPNWPADPDATRGWKSRDRIGLNPDQQARIPALRKALDEVIAEGDPEGATGSYAMSTRLAELSPFEQQMFLEHLARTSGPENAKSLAGYVRNNQHAIEWAKELATYWTEPPPPIVEQINEQAVAEAAVLEARAAEDAARQAAFREHAERYEQARAVPVIETVDQEAGVRSIFETWQQTDRANAAAIDELGGRISALEEQGVDVAAIREAMEGYIATVQRVEKRLEEIRQAQARRTGPMTQREAQAQVTALANDLEGAWNDIGENAALRLPDRPQAVNLPESPPPSADDVARAGMPKERDVDARSMNRPEIVLGDEYQRAIDAIRHGELENKRIRDFTPAEVVASVAIWRIRKRPGEANKTLLGVYERLDDELRANLKENIETDVNALDSIVERLDDPDIRWSVKDLQRQLSGYFESTDIEAVQDPKAPARHRWTIVRKAARDDLPGVQAKDTRASSMYGEPVIAAGKTAVEAWKDAARSLLRSYERIRANVERLAEQWDGPSYPLPEPAAADPLAAARSLAAEAIAAKQGDLNATVWTSTGAMRSVLEREGFTFRFDQKSKDPVVTMTGPDGRAVIGRGASYGDAWGAQQEALRAWLGEPTQGQQQLSFGEGGAAPVTPRTQQPAPVEVPFLDPADNKTPIRTRVVLVDAADVLTSDQLGFPANLQPRSRDLRASSQVQIDAMARDLQPDLLLSTDRGGNGMPVVTPEGAVLAGNGRTAAIRLAADPTYNRYRERLTALAPEYGFDPAIVATMDRPMLVRELVDVDPVAQTRLAWQLNEMPMGDLAPSLASAITREDVRLLKIGDEQTLADALRQPSNQGAVARIIEHLPVDARARYFDPATGVNDLGATLVEGALLSKLLRADDRTLPTFEAARQVVFDVVEQGGEDLKRITNGVAEAAGQILKAQERAETGVIGPEILRFSDDLTPALARLMTAKREAGTMEGALLRLDNVTMFDEGGINPIQTQLAKVLAAASSAKEIRTFMRAVARAADPGAEGVMPMFDDVALDYTGVLNDGLAAWNRLREQTGKPQLDPFPNEAYPYDVPLTAGQANVDGVTTPPVTLSQPLALDEIDTAIAARTIGEPIHEVAESIDDLRAGDTAAVTDVNERAFIEAFVADPDAVRADILDAVDTARRFGDDEWPDFWQGLIEEANAGTISPGDWFVFKQLAGGNIRRTPDGKINTRQAGMLTRDSLNAIDERHVVDYTDRLLQRGSWAKPDGAATVVRQKVQNPISREELAEDVGPDVPFDVDSDLSDTLAGTTDHVITTNENPTVTRAVRARIGAPKVEAKTRSVMEFNAPDAVVQAERLSALRQQAAAALEDAQRRRTEAETAPIEPVEVRSVFRDDHVRELWDRLMRSGVDPIAAGVGSAEPRSLAEIADAVESIDRGMFMDPETGVGLTDAEAAELRAYLLPLMNATLETAIARRSGAAVRKFTARVKPPDDFARAELQDQAKVIMDEVAQRIVRDPTAPALEGWEGTQYLPSPLPTKSKAAPGQPLTPRLMLRDFMGDVIPGLDEELAIGRMESVGRRISTSRATRVIDHIVGARPEKEIRARAIENFTTELTKIADIDGLPRDELAKVESLVEAGFAKWRDHIETTKVGGYQVFRRINLMGPEKMDALFDQAVAEVYGTRPPDWYTAMTAAGVKPSGLWRRADNRLRSYIRESGVPLSRGLERLYGTVADLGERPGRYITVAYHFIRFLGDMRWMALEAVEPAMLTLPTGGVRSVLDSAALTRPGGPASIRRGRPAPKDPIGIGGTVQKALWRDYAHWAATMSDTAQSSGVRMRYLMRELARKQRRPFREALLDMARKEPELARTIREQGDTAETYINRLDRDWALAEQGTKLLDSTAEAERLFKPWLDNGFIDEATYREYVKAKRYTVHPAIEAELARTVGDPLAAALYTRLAEINHGLFNDLTSTFFGQADRSNLQRLVNHPFLYWPVSYQIKATKWLLRFMLDESFGVDTGAATGALIQRAWDEQRRRIATDEGYRERLQANSTLFFMAGMLLPITPTDIGVSMSPWLRMLTNPDYTRQGGVFGWGPFYTMTSLIPRLVAEQTKPGGALADSPFGERLEQAFPQQITIGGPKRQPTSTIDAEAIRIGAGLPQIPVSEPEIPRLP